MAQEDLAKELIYTFKSRCANFDITVPKSISSLTEALDSIAVQLGKSEELRLQYGSCDPFLWQDLRKLWRDLVRAQLTFWDGDDDDGDGNESDDSNAQKNKERLLRSMTAALARFTRNLVAGVSENQDLVFENEPDVRRLLHYYTSWTAVEDPEMVLVARVLTQTLSNMVTGNDPLMDKLWELYLNLREDQVILIRLLTTPDRRTLLATLILIRNCIQGSKARTKLLTKTAIGTRLCIFLFDAMVNLYDEEDESDGAKAFDVGYEIFTSIMEIGLVPDLYSKLAMPDETTTPHQTTLLKLVDSYLQASNLSPEAQSAMPDKARYRLSPMLAKCFFSLSTHAISSIRKALKFTSLRNSPVPESSNSSRPLPPSPQTPAELDVMLPKVCEALVLVSQCMISLLLEAEDRILRQGLPSSSGNGSPSSEKNPKAYFNDKFSESGGIPECLIEVLRLLDVFLPRINFGKPVPRSPHARDIGVPEDHGFSFLKRDLVRLLGLLCHGNKGIQDRVRNAGGIEVIMNQSAVDERNPFLREHAIFTLHNLLEGNPENQAIVEEIKPMGEWDQNGVLVDTAGAVRK